MNENGRDHGFLNTDLTHVAAAWPKLPPHVREAIVTVVDGAMATIHEYAAIADPNEASAEWAAILWATPAERRTSLLRGMLSFEPLGWNAAWEVGRLRTLFATAWESATGMAVPVVKFRRILSGVLGVQSRRQLERFTIAQSVDQMRVELAMLIGGVQQLIEEEG